MAPLGLARAGAYDYDDGVLYGQSSYGDYWSRRIVSSTNSYRLRFYSGLVSPQDNYTRGYGFSVRCLAR